MKHWPDQLSGLRSAHVADGKLFLVLNNSLAAVEEGRQEILRFIGPADCMAVNRLEIIFEELVTNIIRHGFEKMSTQCIHVLVERGESAIRLTFEDDGVPYDLLAAAAPQGGRTVETVQIGGLGIPLIKKMSASLAYEALHPAEADSFRPRNRTIISVAT